MAWESLTIVQIDPPLSGMDSLVKRCLLEGRSPSTALSMSLPWFHGPGVLVSGSLEVSHD